MLLDPEVLAHPRHLELEGSEELPELIMDLARQDRTLLLPHRLQSGRELAELAPGGPDLLLGPAPGGDVPPAPEMPDDPPLVVLQEAIVPLDEDRGPVHLPLQRLRVRPPPVKELPQVPAGIL